jgi:phosphatidylinositol-3-phosphatase
MTASVDRAGPCEACGAPRERGQRYCLECGARAGTRSPQLDELLQRSRERRAAERSELAGVAVASPDPVPATIMRPAGSRPGGLGSRLSGLALPSSRVSAALVLMFLAFGVIVGSVVGTPVQDTLAADAGRHVKLILPPAAPAASPTTATSEASTQSSSEPPAATSEPTPSAATPATTPSTGTKPASGKSSSPLPSSGKGSGDGEGGGSSKSGTSGSSSKLPPIKHVFVIMLSDQPYASAFGPSSASPYLSQTLEHRGELLVRYYAVAHEQLANEIALISGQGPTAETAANCPNYSDIAPATVGADEQVTGQGCVYPSSTETLPGQLTAKHLTWRAYIEGMDEGGTGVPPAPAGGACGHPVLGAAGGGAPIPAATPPAGQTYATWRNPFVYFQALIGSPACASNDVGLNKLASDLSNPKNTPNFAYIAPDLCHDGSPTPCANGAPAGLGAAEGFLKQVVPEITGSKAYKENGLLVITVDQAPSSGAFAESSSCCGQPQFPNLPAASSPLGPKGGGQVGALLLSPYIKQGVSQEPYNHFSLLRTTEDLFDLEHLGYAGLSKVSSFEPSIFAAHPSSG